MSNFQQVVDLLPLQFQLFVLLSMHLFKPCSSINSRDQFILYNNSFMQNEFQNLVNKKVANFLTSSTVHSLFMHQITLPLRSSLT